MPKWSNWRKSDVSVLSDEQLSAALDRLPGWRSEHDGIRRNFQFVDFPSAVSFVNRVAELAEAAGHHPDIDIRYNCVTLALTTHDEGGVTEKDTDLASRLDEASV